MSYSEVVAKYVERTPRSAAHSVRARDVFAGGVTTDVRVFAPHPPVIDRASGAYKWDIDGNRYVDFTGGHGAHLFGHAHPEIVRAVSTQVGRGTHFGLPDETELSWGESVLRLFPKAQRCRFVNSGTEATMLALRLSRAATGRPKILRFFGHYHGWNDHVLVGQSSPTPPPGLVTGVGENMVVCPGPDLDAVKRLLDTREIAAVILEPTGAQNGKAPLPPGFLQELRTLTSERGTLLIFDEIITGRGWRGGAQGRFDVRPDLSTLGKVIAGGLPGAALIGTADVMDLMAFRADAKWNASSRVSHQGTYNGNPLTAAAGVAAIRLMLETSAIDDANRIAQTIRDRLNAIARDRGVPYFVYGATSEFHFVRSTALRSLEEIMAGRYEYSALSGPTFTKLRAMMRVALLTNGVDISLAGHGMTSCVHSEADVDITAQAFEQFIATSDGDV